MAYPRPSLRFSPRVTILRVLATLVVALAITIHSAPAGVETPSKKLLDLDRALSRSAADPVVSANLAEELLGDWASRDPASAMRFALSDDHTHAVFLQAAGNIMETWARKDPVAARLFFEQLGEMSADLVAPSLLQGYGSAAPESALEWIHTGVSSEKLRSILAKSVVGVYETARRTEEIKLWLSLPGVATAPEGATAAGELARRTARRDPLAAVGFCKSLPNASAARLAALHATARQWASGNPEACREWLGSATVGLSRTEVDQVISGFLDAFGSNPPEDSTDLLGAISDPKLRSTLSKSHALKN